MTPEGTLVMDSVTFLESARGSVTFPTYQVLLVSGVGTLNFYVPHSGNIIGYRYLTGSGEVNLNRGTTQSITTLPTGVYADRLLDCVANSVAQTIGLMIPVTAGEIIICGFIGAATIQLILTNELT